MLDTEPTGGGSETAASATADHQPTNPDQSPNGTGAAPRRRRATRPAQSAAPEAEAEAPPAARRRRAATRPAAAVAEPVAEPAAEAPAAPARRSRSARRPVGATADAAAADGPTEAAVETQPAPVLDTDHSDDSAVPLPRSRRRRSTAVEFAPPVDDSVEAEPEVVASKAARGSLPPIVTFQAPEPVPETTSRRRRATRPAAAAESTLTEPLLDANGDPIEDELAEELLADATDAAVLDAEASLTSEDVDEDEPTEDDGSPSSSAGRRRRRGRRGRGRGRSDENEPGEASADVPGETEASTDDPEAAADGDEMESDGRGGTRRRRRRRSRGSSGEGAEPTSDDPPNTVVRVRNPRQASSPGTGDDEVRGLTGSTRLEAKRQRRREGREQGKRRPPVLTEAEFLARREAVDRVMVVRQTGDRTQIAVLEDEVLVEHYVTKASATSYAGNVYLGKVQNVLPSMEAAFVDIGKGRNAVLYAGEVNYDASGIEGRAHRIEQALKPGQTIMVQVTKDPIGHKGSRLTSQISLPGRFLVYVPDGRVTGISRKLPDAERTRLKAILKRVMPEDAGVIVRTAAEGASEEDLERDVARLHAQWESIQAASSRAGSSASSAPALLYAEPDLVVRVIRDIFNEDFRQLIVQGGEEWETVESYVQHLAPDLAPRLTHWVDNQDVFSAYRVDEQLTKALDRKVWLPSGGSLVIDRTEAMVVVDVNTGKFVGKGGNLEETVTKNNLEAAEEVVRQLRLRDLGGIIVIDFIDMVLESNRELVLRRLMECLGRDRTKHQVAEVTSLGLVQMTRKRVGQGLLESFSEVCPECQGRGFIVHMDHGAPTVPDRGDDGGRREGSNGSNGNGSAANGSGAAKGRTGKGRERGTRSGAAGVIVATVPDEAPRAAAAAAIAKIAAASGVHPVGAPAEADQLDEGPVPEARPAGRRGRRGASAPAGSPAPVEAHEVSAVDVTPVEAVLEPADGEAPAPRSRRRRGGSGSGSEQASSVGHSEQALRESVAAAVAAGSDPGASVPAAGSGAPRRRRAASRPAGPAAGAPVPSAFS